MSRLPLLLLAAALLGCAAAQVQDAPLPASIRHIALHPIVNKTGQAGLEDALMLRTRDEFLRDGRYALVPEKDADAVLWITLTRYNNTPIQYDAALAPLAYKLRIVAALELRDKQKPGLILREDKALDGIQIYAAGALAGGMSETQAQSQVWDLMARDIVKKLVSDSGVQAR